MDEKEKKELKEIELLKEKLIQFTNYLPEKVSLKQLKQLEKIVDAEQKSDENKVLKAAVKRIILNDELNTLSFLKNVPDLQNDLTKLPKGTIDSFRERVIYGILNMTINSYLTYSPLGLQQYVGVDMITIKGWLQKKDKTKEDDKSKKDNINDIPLWDLWKMLHYKFEFYQGVAIAKENIKNFNINPNMFDFNLGASILSLDGTYEDEDLNLNEFIIDKAKEKNNEWKQFEKEIPLESQKEITDTKDSNE